MTTTEAFTVKIEPAIVHQLDQMAESQDRSRHDIVNQVLKEYLQHHTGQIEKIQEGITASDRGERVDHDDMMNELEELLAEKAKTKS
jgi:predicted transcriptional regulator